MVMNEKIPSPANSELFLVQAKYRNQCESIHLQKQNQEFRQTYMKMVIEKQGNWDTVICEVD